MMIIYKTEDFKKAFRKLPSDAKGLYRKQEAIFKENWLDARLHVKRIKELKGAYSFRVTRRYRVLFYFQGKEKVVFFTVGHRKDIYK